MNGQQRYQERRRLRAERLLREEQEAHSKGRAAEAAENTVTRLMDSMERIASAMELWADLQIEPKSVT
jgi:hypothetical protein